jgi:uncharacterized protein (DUF302 family)
MRAEAMIRIETERQLEDMEAALCRAAQRHGAHVLSVTPFDSLLSEEARRLAHGAISFAVCHTGLYGALLAADLRFAAFLPCRIVVIRQGAGLAIETVPPRQFCRDLGRPDLDRLAVPLETLLRDLIADAARPAAGALAHPRAGDGALGAREGQVAMRASIPPRIDCHGTKIEDLAGTGKLDAPGG